MEDFKYGIRNDMSIICDTLVANSAILSHNKY